MDNRHNLQQEFVRKLTEMESKNKKQFTPHYDMHLRMFRDIVGSERRFKTWM